MCVWAKDGEESMSNNKKLQHFKCFKCRGIGKTDYIAKLLPGGFTEHRMLKGGRVMKCDVCKGEGWIKSEA
jgi:hypothetical protein